MSSSKTPSKILKAAKKLLSEKGFAEMTMQAIAAEVGVSKAALYHFFSSKEDIYVAVMSALLSELSIMTKDVLRLDCSAEDKLRRMISSRLQFALKNQALIRIWDMAQLTIEQEKLGKLCCARKGIKTLTMDVFLENQVKQPNMALLVLMSSILKYVKSDGKIPLPPPAEFSKYLSDLFLSLK